MSAESDYDAAYAHAIAGSISKSETLCREILATTSDHAEAIHLLGVIAAKRGDVPTAIALFNRALASKPDFARAHSNLGAVLLECGETEKARRSPHAFNGDIRWTRVNSTPAASNRSVRTKPSPPSQSEWRR